MPGFEPKTMLRRVIKTALFAPNVRGGLIPRELSHLPSIDPTGRPNTLKPASAGRL
jgi:hypothetical protein